VRASLESGTVDWIMTFPDGSVGRALSRPAMNVALPEDRRRRMDTDVSRDQASRGMPAGARPPSRSSASSTTPPDSRILTRAETPEWDSGETQVPRANHKHFGRCPPDGCGVQNHRRQCGSGFDTRRRSPGDT
jgi:hypothetical protein